MRMESQISNFKRNQTNKNQITMSKNQTNLEIISRREHITARGIVRNNVVTFAYDKENGHINAVGFSVVRGQQTDTQFTGNETFRGSVYGQAFQVDNRDYQIGDSLIYEEIYVICQQIMKPENES